MRARIVSIGDMTGELIAKWNAWAAPGGRLVSPYFRFEFTDAIARVREDVRIAILEDDDGVAGFFPFHAPRDGVIRPVGAPMSDYQGVIARPGARIDLPRLVRAAGGSAVVFDNWYCPAGGLPAARRGREGSAMVDLSGGAGTYFDTRRGAHRNHFRKMSRRQRAAERDIGPVRVCLDDPDGRAFARLDAWKQAQYRDTGKLNVFGIGWVREALADFRTMDGAGLHGLTASLWFGDRLAAVEFGLAAGGIYHSWFPAYDPELARYSPGLLLLHGLFDQAGAHGIDRVDLGRGGDHYKKYYTSYEVPLDQGRVLVPGMAAAGIRSWELAERAAGLMPGAVAELPVRLRRRWAQVSAFQPHFAPRIASFAGSVTR
ncbi:MAG: GNAT family N-acetyltransferase [Pseudomonadota bacterium]|nr:GNAT family N-acetyltransferase [Pseudomonadota bacterium]